MTRFARAKGSKASNERVPEEATSWQEMKRQMEEKKLEEKAKKEKAEYDSKATTYRQSLCDVDTTVTWASFQDKPSKKIKNEDKGNVLKKTKEKRKTTFDELNSTVDQMTKDNEVISTKGVDLSETTYDSDDAPMEVSAKLTPAVEVATKPMKRKRECITIDIDAGRTKTDETKKRKLEKTSEDVKRNKTSRGNKNKSQQDKTETARSSKNDSKRSNVNEVKKNKTKGKNKKKLQQDKTETVQTSKNDSQKSPIHSGNKNSKRKLAKVRDDKEHKRRKPLLEDNTIILNGKKVELQYFGGFLIKREDATRLYMLRKEMRGKGVPPSELDIILKLERRKAEKALAREKKKLCFQCRQSGHELSECPNINDGPNVQSMGTGICFKCGSTEHTHFECKVVRNDNYKFATCFICKEEGHISKQCPDNPKGIYPRGGACKICQDVTHLKKDCPVFQQQQESASATLNTIGAENIEGIDGEHAQVGARKKIKSKKVIKFKD